VSTFVESFIGDTPIGTRTTDMIVKDELWSAGDVISLKQHHDVPANEIEMMQ
jgi:hypothetical protein